MLRITVLVLLPLWTPKLALSLPFVIYRSVDILSPLQHVAASNVNMVLSPLHASISVKFNCSFQKLS